MDKAAYCYYCTRPFLGAKGCNVTTDHFVPLSKHGANRNWNKVVCCGQCNELKGDLLPDEFSDKIMNMLRWKSHEPYTLPQMYHILSQIEHLKTIEPQHKHPGHYLIKKQIKEVYESSI